MGWAKFDDQFTDHPKVQAVGPMAELLAMRAVIYSARYETDGLIRESVLPRLTVGITSPKKQIAALLRENLWEKHDDGWLIHDYLDYHPSKADKDAERQAARERMANVRANKKRTKGNGSGEQTPKFSDRSDYPDPTPPDTQPLPTVEVTDEPLILDESKSDPDTGLEVWVDAEGKQRQRIDGLWDAATRIWGTPKTKQEHGRRNKEIKELRLARVHPEMLEPLFAKASVRWKGTRPQLNGIITNLGDLLEGIEISPQDVKRYHAEMQRARQRQEILGGPDGA